MIQKIFFVLVVINFTACGNKRANKLTNEAQAQFEYHFAILDSVMKASRGDTIFHCCFQSILFMQKHTKIIATPSGDILGKSSYTESDLENWHRWYKEHFPK